MKFLERIAVFGGTFNPIHNGHIHIAESFAEILPADRVILIPTSVPPHKRTAELASAADRLAMCRLAARGRDRLEVSDLEIRRGGASYTSDTLLELRRINPDSPLFLITGEDMFLTLADWHCAETIFSLAAVCAAPRSEDGTAKLLQYAERLERLGAQTVVEPIEYLPVSSTMVREAVREEKDISQMVPAPVERYIRRNKLYLE